MTCTTAPSRAACDLRRDTSHSAKRAARLRQAHPRTPAAHKARSRPMHHFEGAGRARRIARLWWSSPRCVRMACVHPEPTATVRHRRAVWRLACGRCHAESKACALREVRKPCTTHTISHGRPAFGAAPPASSPLCWPSRRNGSGENPTYVGCARQSGRNLCPPLSSCCPESVCAEACEPFPTRPIWPK